MQAKKLFFIPAVLMAMLVFSALMVPQAHASQARSQILSGAAIAHFSSQCAVTGVQLHGNQAPTLTCLQAQNMSKARPNIGQAYCPGYFNFQLYYNHGNNTICFSGVGYMGFSGFNYVTWIDGYCASGWIKAYQPAGHGFTVYWNSSTAGPVNYQSVTQIDIQITNC